MKAQDIATEIINGNFSQDEINTIWSALQEAQRIGRAKQTAVAIATIRVGATGVLQNLRPARINGTRVEVKEIKRTKVTVQEIGKTGFESRYRVPASCIKLDA